MGVRGLFTIGMDLSHRNSMNRNFSLFLAAIPLLIVVMMSGCWSGSSNSRNDTAEKWVNISSSPQSNNSQNKKVNEQDENGSTKATTGNFDESLPSGFVRPTDDVGRRMLKEYGSLFVAKGGAKPPNTVIFRNEEEVSSYQTSISKEGETVGGIAIELQSVAMEALKIAVQDAKSKNLTITPRGKDAGRRTYTGTVELWKSRVDPGLSHWTQAGRITSADAQRIKSLEPFEQVPEIFKLESQGMYFSKDLSKSIVYSVAPPGTSQHLSMLALDVAEYDNAQVREILANHGWFQTVISDLPHFTFLGAKEDQLTGLGLRKVSESGRVFWVPKL